VTIIDEKYSSSTSSTSSGAGKAKTLPKKICVPLTKAIAALVRHFDA
jgi:hypothetical protein